MAKDIRFGVSYYGAYHKDDIVRNLAEIKEAGFDILVLAVSENDWQNFRGVVEFSVKHAKSLGFEVLVDLWGFGGAFGGETGSLFLARNPESRQVLGDGSVVQMACLNDPAFRDFVKASCAEMSRHLSIDGFFIDEPHFHFNPARSERACFCRHCAAAAGSKGLDLKKDADLARHKSDSVVSFVSDITSAIKAARDVKTVVCIFPDERDGAYDKGSLVKLASLDVLATDPYWSDPYWKSMFVSDEGFVRRNSEKVISLAQRHKKKSEIWVQGFGIKAGEEGSIDRYAGLIAGCSPDRLMFWTYNCGWGSCVSADNPALCWKTMKSAVKRLKRGAGGSSISL